MNWKRALIGIVVAAVLIAGGVFMYRQYFAPQAEEPAGAADATATPVAAGVNTVAVNRGVGGVSAEGTVLPARHVALALKGTGQVVDITTPEGVAVKAGDAILRLDSQDQEAALSRAEAELAQARANLEAAEAGKAAAEMGRQSAELGVQAAEAELALAKAAPRPEDLALAEGSVALAEARINRARAAQALVNEGAPGSGIRAAEAELQAAQAQTVPARLRLEQLRLEDDPDPEALAQAERDYNAALAAVEAAQAVVDELRAGATAAQQQAAGSGVAAAAAQRDAAQAELDLLLAGSQAEQIAIAEAGVSRAAAALTQAQAQVGASESAVAQAQAAVSRAEAAVESARLALADRTLLAPFDGTVADVTVDVGEVAAAGVPAAVVADLAQWTVETTDLTELDVVNVAVGMPVEVRVDALPDRVLQGVVSDIALVSEDFRGDTVYKVTISLDDPGDVPLRWGMTVFVTIDTDR